MTRPRQLANLLLLAAIFQFDSATAAMKVPAKFNVSVMGSATYSIPLVVVPGTASMAPSLALSYDSSTGNGLLGKGWSLSGLSSISRCPSTTAQDGGIPGALTLSASDRFCLDGARLMVSNGGAYGANGTEYRTEEDGFSRIVSYGAAGDGPAWFKVWTKAGQVMEFGNTPDSRIEAQGRAVARVWALNKVQDVKSNYLTINYTEDAANGDYYPARIDYTGNASQSMAPNNSVQFTYAARNDIETAYRGGALTRSAVRMTNVKTYAGSTMVMDYQINYATAVPGVASQIASLRGCGATGQCLPATNLAWTYAGTTVPLSGSWLATGVEPEVNYSEWFDVLIPLDINGDGKTDLVQPFFRNGTLWLLPMISNGTTFVIGTAWNSGLMENGATILPGDINGDGRGDLVYSTYFTEGVWSHVPLLSTGSGFTVGTRLDVPDYATQTNPSTNYVGLYAIDVNGDGRTDLVQAYKKLGDLKLQVMMSNGSTWTAGALNVVSSKDDGMWGGPTVKLVPADLNGDGKMDLVETWFTQQPSHMLFLPLLSNGSGFSAAGPWFDSGLEVVAYGNSVMTAKDTIPLDVNGDGISEIVAVDYDKGNVLALLPFYFIGSGFTRGIESDIIGGPYANDHKIHVADLNGDGKMDIVQQVWAPDYKLLFQPIFSDGTRFIPGTVFDTGQRYDRVQRMQEDSNGDWGMAWSTVGAEFFLDINGDGKSDFVQLQYGAAPMSILPYVSDQRMGGLLDTITDGLGATIQMTYRPITDNTIYTKESTASYPIMDMQGPTYVVASVKKSNGAGGLLTTNFSYGGMKMDLTGRGMLGMRWNQSQDMQSGIVSRTEFRQDWPYVGLPVLATKRLSGAGNAGLLSQITTNYACTDFVSGSGCVVAPLRRYFTAPSNSVTASWDLNGASFPTTTVDTSYDAWGNPVSVITTKGPYVNTVINGYTNDATNWFIGLLTSKTVTNTMP